jgi:hypothetical protein
MTSTDDSCKDMYERLFCRYETMYYKGRVARAHGRNDMFLYRLLRGLGAQYPFLSRGDA